MSSYRGHFVLPEVQELCCQPVQWRIVKGFGFAISFRRSKTFDGIKTLLSSVSGDEIPRIEA